MTKEKGVDTADLKTLVIDDTHYSTKLTKKYENRKVWQNPDPRKIISALPGTVLSVEVKVGDKVKEGQVVMTFEAMKMVNSIRTAIDGTVKSVNITAGAKIPKNLLMFELE